MEIINCDSIDIACDGGNPPYDHPKVYYKIDTAKGFVTCSYCAKKFVLTS
ncbi:MAG: zinc-finger domain-containing protein [Rickettsiaceae bacterium]|nr:MAG: zinc-finger domain-containing protein [Rickettsiaceae bacterium]